MTIEWLAGNRLRGTTAERPAYGLAAGVSGGWVELGRHVLGSTASEVFVASLPDKQYYMVLYEDKGQASAQARLLRYNSDSGSNYANRVSTNGASDTSQGSQPQHNGWNAHNTTPQFNVWYIANLPTKEKLLISQGIFQNTAGAGTAPSRTEYVGKWANTSAAINRIGVIQNAGTHSIGTTMTVLGWDPTDSHTTNFWELLGSDTSTGSATSLESGTIAAKKYLWIQVAIKGLSASTFCETLFNNDTGSNYSSRGNQNGGSDFTRTSQTDLNMFESYGNTTPAFLNAFIINNSANEKLGISHSVRAAAAGAGTAPVRDEVTFKWANTSAQITDISFTPQSGTIVDGSELRIWGSD